MNRTRLPQDVPSSTGSGRRGKGAGRRRVACAALAVMPLLNVACYSYVPLDVSPQPGTEVRLELNDRGRAALADSIGPTAHRIEGTLRSASDSAYELDVRSVEYYTGRVQRWSGEDLRIPMSFVSQSRERRFDRKRSLLVGVGATAAVVLAILGNDLVGGGSPGPTPVDPPPVGDQ